MSATDQAPCFGFYSGTNNPTCANCAAAKRCKAILISDGFDILASMVAHLAEELPAASQFRDTARVTKLVEQLLSPPKCVPVEDEELLGVLQQAIPNDIDLDAF